MWSGSSRTPEGPADRCSRTGKIKYANGKAAIRASIGFKRRKGSHFRKDERALQAFPCYDDDGDHFHIGHTRAHQNSRRERPQREKRRRPR